MSGGCDRDKDEPSRYRHSDISKPIPTRTVVLDPEFDTTSQKPTEHRFGHYDPEGLRLQMEKAQADCNRAAQVRTSDIHVPSLDGHIYELVAIRQFAAIKVYVHDSRSYELFFSSNREISDFLKDEIAKGALTAQTVDGNIFYHTGQIYALVDKINRGQST